MRPNEKKILPLSVISYINNLKLDFIFFLTQPIKMNDLRRVNPRRACEYFNSCFKDPSTFTVVIVGSINPSIAVPLILQYLVSEFPQSICLEQTKFLLVLTFPSLFLGRNTKAF